MIGDRVETPCGPGEVVAVIVDVALDSGVDPQGPNWPRRFLAEEVRPRQASSRSAPHWWGLGRYPPRPFGEFEAAVAVGWFVRRLGGAVVSGTPEED